MQTYEHTTINTHTHTKKKIFWSLYSCRISRRKRKGHCTTLTEKSCMQFVSSSWTWKLRVFTEKFQTKLVVATNSIYLLFKITILYNRKLLEVWKSKSSRQHSVKGRINDIWQWRMCMVLYRRYLGFASLWSISWTVTYLDIILSSWVGLE